MMEMFDAKPGFSLTVNGMPALLLNQNINSITLTENRGFDADTLQITVNDNDGLIALPDRNAEITLAIGFGLNLIDKGKFIVDSITHSGPPDVITIGAHSADFKKEFLERKSGLYENKTLEEIIKEIASKHKLEYKVADIFKKIKVQAKQQADESDANLLTRIAEEFDAVATIKNNILLFLERGKGKTASGESLATITHHRSDGDQQLKRLKRSAASVSVNLARGNAELSAESPLKLVGFKTEMDNHNWIVTTITHRIDASNGFVSELQGEVKT